ncbi:MAG TPA: LysR substrate-binding domain-containing protein [Burkholderiaceae bacterium]|nr:LysR substrate-binding domain-containing protein [Burkholderiaceae bacterium]
MNPTRDLPVSLDLLRGFEAAARLLSFTGAAAELFLTQSAVSRQVQQLEEQLGVKLFERRTRALELTEAGERYFREVAKALNHLREATAAVRARSAPVVRVTATVTFASLWLVPRLAGFQERHDDVSVHVVADNALRELERASLDVAIRYTQQAMVGKEAVRLFGERVAPVASPAFLKKHPVRSLDDLLRLPLLERDDPGPGAWLSWRAWFDAMSIAPPRRTGLSFSHYDQIVQAAISGQGIALGRLPLVNDFLRDGRLVRVLPGDEYAIELDRAYWLVVAPAAAVRDEVQVFSEWLQAEARRATTESIQRRPRRA